MPFVKVKRKGQTRYRGPSGRTFNKAQVRRYYARGSKFDAATCGCGQSHQQGFFCDAAKVTQSDPTGTLSIRKLFAREFDRRWRLVKQAVNSALRDHDQFGLNPESVIAVQVISSPGGRLKAFQTWFDAILGAHVFGDRGAWVATPVMRGYERGWGRAMRMTKGGPLKSSVERSQLISAATVIEVQGVMEAVSQQASRAFNAVLLSGSSPREAAFLVNKVVDDVGVLRSHAVASFMTVQAHATGTLDGFEARGVKRVGLEPEYNRVARVGDANPYHKPPGPGGGQFTSGPEGGGSSEVPTDILKKATQGHGLTSAKLSEAEKEQLSEWLKKQPRSDVPVYRGIWIQKSSELENWKAGTEHDFRALSSFTEDPIRTAAYGTGGEFFVRIDMPAGETVNIAPHSVYPQEQEHVLPEGGKFEVVERTRPNPGDFVVKVRRKRTNDGLIQDAPRKLTARQQKLFERRENKLNRLGLVNVETAGDEKVCPQCEQIEEEGPYSIDEARTLIPAHPSAVLEGSTIATYGPIHEMVASVFVGPAVELRTRTKLTTIGPNHPVLTRRGFVKACQLTEGDELVYDTRTEHTGSSGTFDHTHFKQMPMVEDVFGAFQLIRASRTATSGHDFHGDAKFCQGEIHVVHPTRQLLPVLDASVIEKLCERDLVRSNTGLFIETAFRSFDLFAQWCLTALGRRMRGSNLLYALGGGHAIPLDALLFAVGSKNANSTQASCQHPTFNSMLTRQGNDSIPALVGTNNTFRNGSSTFSVFRFEPVLSIRHVEFSGWAFDASTQSGIYNSDGFVVKNCRCAFVPLDEED